MAFQNKIKNYTVIHILSLAEYTTTSNYLLNFIKKVIIYLEKKDIYIYILHEHYDQIISF